MNDLAIADALLRHPGVTAIVGESIALDHLDEGTPLPAIAYQVFTTPQPYLAAGAEAVPQLMRLQVNVLAQTPGAVQALHAAIHAALAWHAGQTVAGCWVTRIAPQAMAGFSKDEATGTWTRPRDYLITFEE